VNHVKSAGEAWAGFCSDPGQPVASPENPFIVTFSTDSLDFTPNQYEYVADHTNYRFTAFTFEVRVDLFSMFPSSCVLWRPSQALQCHK
jgi:hypothetical protein